MKKPRLNLSLKKHNRLSTDSKQFSSPIKKERFQVTNKGVVPTNTKSSTQWAVRTLSVWMSQQNARVSADDAVPMDLLECHDPEKVSKYMHLEARRTDSQPYPPATICSLLSGFQHVMQVNKVPFNMFDKGNQRFWELHLILDTVSSDLHYSLSNHCFNNELFVQHSTVTFISCAVWWI